MRLLAMKQPKIHASSIAPVRSGYSLLELTVALTLLGIALSGLFPLTAMLSRHLQPIPTNATAAYNCRTPARDGNTTGASPTGGPRAYGRHIWYLTPFHNTNTPANDAWVRKLGCSAQVNKNSADACPATLSVSPPPSGIGIASPSSSLPIQPAVLYLDDYDPNGTPLNSNSIDGRGTFTTSSPSWTYVPPPQGSPGYQGDYHWHSVPTDQNDPSLSSDVATWQLTVLADGWYSIQATWPTATAPPLPLAGATYQVVTAPSRPVTLLPTSQTTLGGIKDTSGTTWWPLTTLVQLKANDVVTVTLGVPRNVTTPGLYVIADAVRIVQNEVKVSSIERSLGGTNNNSDSADVTAHVSVTVNLPQ
jgi:prepilin-type N-terminal cleavage/methylation domain-containing protein